MAVFGRRRRAGAVLDRPPPAGSTELGAAAARLAALGFWAGLPTRAVQVQRHAVARGVHPLATEPGPRVQVRADGEQLAEGGVEAFLREQVAPLVAEWVALDVTTASGPDTHRYVVVVQGRPCELFGTADWGHVDHRHPWHAATVRPLAVVNELLAEAGAPVRWHVLHAGGNDGVALLLRPAVVDVLVDAGFDAPHDVPRPAI